MNNKGFTLVELLGVIVIIGALITIISISVGGVLDKSEIKLTEIQIKKIEEAAKNYYISEGMDELDFEQNNFVSCVNASYLIENGYIDNNEISNFETGDKMLGSVIITYNSKKYQYQYAESSCQVCIPVPEEMKTTGNVSEGKYLPGDEYICEVKDNTQYHFFVLGTEGDNVNLIMDRNICEDGTPTDTNKTDKCTVPWINKEDYTELGGTVGEWEGSDNDSGEPNENESVLNIFGPVTALKYLHNATKDWDNIPNIVINYDDENIFYDNNLTGLSGYGSVKTTENITIVTDEDGEETLRIENLKTKMPSYFEVRGTDKCLSLIDANGRYGNCPLWLSNYLTPHSDVTGEGLQNISGITGYWLFTSSGGGPHPNPDPTAPKYGFHQTWAVVQRGLLGPRVSSRESYGVRPVINLKKENLMKMDMK